MIAALYVEKDGAYYGLPDVDCWDKDRDARLYDGPYPVVAHPPCQRWGKMYMGSPSAVARGFPRKKLGDDGGCSEHALSSVRKYGGVLEHPMYSHAWKYFGLVKPPKKGGWVQADEYGGWTCCLEQGRYGHWVRKPTWLYAVETERPEFDWGHSKPSFPDWAIERHGLERCKKLGEVALKGGGVDDKHRNMTPVQFRDILIKMARSVKETK